MTSWQKFQHTILYRGSPFYLRLASFFNKNQAHSGFMTFQHEHIDCCLCQTHAVTPLNTFWVQPFVSSLISLYKYAISMSHLHGQSLSANDTEIHLDFPSKVHRYGIPETAEDLLSDDSERKLLFLVAWSFIHNFKVTFNSRWSAFQLSGFLHIESESLNISTKRFLIFIPLHEHCLGGRNCYSISLMKKKLSTVFLCNQEIQRLQFNMKGARTQEA